MESRKQVRSLKILLKDMEPYVRDAKFLHSGRKFENFKLLPREIWANWLMCVVLQKLHDADITFAEDDNCDGLFIDKKTGRVVATEHVSALEIPKANLQEKGEARILHAIEHKIKRGCEYAEGKFLIVFFDGAVKWYRNRLREAINGKHNFKSIYCIGLLTVDDSGYAYSLTQFHPKMPETSITYKVKINSSFTDWQVYRLEDREDGIAEIPL